MRSLLIMINLYDSFRNGKILFAAGIFSLCGLLSAASYAGDAKPDQVNAANYHPGYFAFIPSNGVIPSDVLYGNDFVGVKIKYTWRELETGLGEYDFSQIERHLKILQEEGKRLWIQVEYVQWNSGSKPSTPEYMWNNPVYGGDSRFYGNYERSVQNGGWYPLFWNPEVRKRMVALAMAIGLRFQREEFVEGFSIPETAADRTDGFDCQAYQESLKSMAVAAKVAFGEKAVLQMINYACFDLPQYAAWLDSQGIGIGTPDVYEFKSGLTDVVYPLMLKHGSSVPVGPDVQWSDYDRNTLSVAGIRDFAIKTTNPSYMFWRVREPYFSDEVLPAVWRRKLPVAEAFYNSGTLAAAPRAPILE